MYIYNLNNQQPFILCIGRFRVSFFKQPNLFSVPFNGEFRCFTLFFFFRYYIFIIMNIVGQSKKEAKKKTIYKKSALHTKT